MDQRIVHSSHLLRTLNQQIDAMRPIRDSHGYLQNYYLKLSNEFEALLHEKEGFSTEISQKMTHFNQINQQLEHQYHFHLDQIKQVDFERAKAIMNRNNITSTHQALKKKLSLENIQHSNLQNQFQDILQNKEKLQYNIQKYQELTKHLDSAIQQKYTQNSDIQGQITKIESINHKIEASNSHLEEKIRKVDEENDALVHQSKELDSKIETYQKLIENKHKNNKESLELFISKSQEHQNLKNRKEYIQHLLTGEQQTKRKFSSSLSHLESHLNIKMDELSVLTHQNQQYSELIEKQKEKIAQEEIEKARMKDYLYSLVQSNELLFRELERSCSEDRKVQQILTEKLQKLVLTNDKMNDRQFMAKNDLKSQEYTYILKQQCSSSPKNKDILRRTRDTSSKENYLQKC